MNKAVAASTKESIDAKDKDNDEINQISVEIMSMSKGNGKKNGETIGSPDITAVASAMKLRSIMVKAKP